MIFYVLNSDEKLVETIQSPDESGVAGITAIQGVVEEKLSTYELIELIVPADSDGLEEIEEEMTIIFKDISGWREYIIYEIEDIDGDSLETTIRAELSSSELIDEVIERDIRGISNNPERNLEEILDGTRWLAGQVDSSLYSQPLNVDTNYMNVLEALNEYATRYGAEIRFRYEVDGNKVVRRYVDAYKQFGEYKGKIFEIDRDMTSVKRTVNTELIKTTIIPYSKELPVDPEDSENKETYRIGIEDIEWKKSNGDPVDKPLGQNYLVDPVALERWGKLNADGSRRHKKIPMEFDFDNAEAIISMAWVQLGRYTQPRVSYEVSAIDLYAMTGDEDLKHEQILLGDTGGVKDYYFSNPLEIQTRLVEVKRDLFDPRNNDYVFGDPRTIFSANASVEVAEEMAKDMEDVITRIENAQISIDGKTKVFRGSEVPVNPEENDIWFRPHPSKQGHTQMMLFNGANWEIHVDSSDLEDAGRLTFGTIDGAEINVINLIADNITGGQLKLENGIEITHRGIPILKVNNSGEVELNISKMTINAMNIEEELERIQEFEDGKDAYELAVENGFVGTMEEWLESLKGEDGKDGSQGPQGVQGPAGKDGKATYTWIRYADTASGGGISNNPTGKEYIGLAHNKDTPTESDTPTDYTWSLIKGPQGETGNRGVEGPKGKDGETTYTWIKYSANANGSGLTDTPQANTAYIGIATNKSTEAESNTPSDYTWTLFKGPKGDTGEQGPRGLQGQQGPEGKQGIKGDDGDDGTSTYTHIAYSTSKTGANFSHSTFDTATYIGMYVSNESDSSETPSDYEWTLIKGKDGSQGLRGPEGKDGRTPYFHTAWANSADGVSGFSTTVSINKLYIGTATTFESDDPEEPSEYSWTKIKGDKGDAGKGIKSQVVTYQNHSNGTTAPTGSWSDNPSPVKGQYLWTRTVTTYTEGNPITTYAVAYNALDGQKGDTGDTGGKGNDGTGISSTVIRYFQSASGTTPPTGNGATTPPTPIQGQYNWTRTEITYTDGTKSTAWSTSYNALDGQKGDTGATGSTGPKGDDGKGIQSQTTTYQNHTNGTTTPTGTWTSTPSPVKGQYLWARTITTYTIGNPVPTYSVSYNATDGQRGPEGTGISSTQIRYQQSTSGNQTPTGTWHTTIPDPVEGRYLWTRTLITYTDNSTSTSYSTSYYATKGEKGDKGDKGDQGPQGIRGPAGANGQSQYTHIRYSANSNGSGMDTKPSSTTKYVGIAVTNSATAPVYTGFTWSKYVGDNGSQGPQGPQGTQGIQGPAGANGQPTYTWVKYAEDKNGGGMSDYPEGKRFIGLAFNKTTATESTTASHYQWSEMPQNIEIGGRNLLVQHTITEGGFLTSTGAFSANSAWFHTDYIPVSGYTKLITSGYTNLGSSPAVVYYDADFTFVKGIANGGVSRAKEITIDSGIAYIRFSGEIKDLPTLKLEKGNIATDWTESPEDAQAKLDEKADTDLIDNIQNQLDEFVLVDGYETEIGEINQALLDYKDLIESGEVATEEAVGDIKALLDRTVAIENNLGEFAESWNFDVTEITMGEEGLFLGDNLTDMGIRIAPQVGDTPPRIDFVDNGTVVAEITGQYMKINRGIFVKSAQIGEHQIETIAGGHTIWQWIPSTP